MRKLIAVFMLMAVTTSCFSAFSGGSRGGFSGGRSFSASRSYSAPVRSGYSRPSTPSRPYVAPRSSTTVVHNNHYSSHSGFGGGGFFSGFLGGMLGSSIGGSHAPVVVAGGQPVVSGGQGILMEQPYIQAPYSIWNGVMSFIFVLFLLLFFIWASVKVYQNLAR